MAYAYATPNLPRETSRVRSDCKLVKRVHGPGRWAPDCWTKAPPVLIPLVSLGRRAVATEGQDAHTGTFSMRLAHEAAGGQELRAISLSSDLFEAAKMEKVIKDLMAMKVDELKLELEERGEAKSGNKAWLRRRLHAAILRDYLEGWIE